MEITLKFLVTYFVQVGGLWGILEGYTYFKDDAFKNFTGDYWALFLYGIPAVTTLLYILHQSSSKKVNPDKTSTRGDFSPGSVGGNYSIGSQPTPYQTASSNKTANTTSTNETISTQGDYSPASVEGNYNIRGTTPLKDNSKHKSTVNPASDQKDVDADISTKGNYSPGRVGGDYTIDH